MNASEIQRSISTAVQMVATGDTKRAESLFREILISDPTCVPALGNLGDLLLKRGCLAEAQSFFERICSLQPRAANGYYALGLALGMQRRFSESAQASRRAIELDPSMAPAYVNLSNALRGGGDAAEAERVCRAGLAHWPEHGSLLSQLAFAFLAQGRHAEAIEAAQKAITLPGAGGDAFANLGAALAAVGRRDEALPVLRRAVELNPSHPLALVELSHRVRELGRISESLQLIERAIAADPNDAELYNSIGPIYLASGKVAAAIAAFRRALTLRPTLAQAGSNLLLTLNYVPDVTAEEVFAEHRAWAARLPGSAKSLPARVASMDENRPLRVGYVSADFRDHAVAHFLEPVLASHDREQIEAFCYSDVRATDIVSARMKEHAARWRDTGHLTNAALANTIADDGIDILVDCAGHTAGNRLPMFAQRAAPVQATYIGYPNTSGLDEMDYWITDAWNDPPGQTEPFATERLIRLPRVFACYQPPDSAPLPDAPPAARRDYVTFGCFNMLGKLNDTVLALWSRVLSATPNARLMLMTGPLRDADVRRETANRFERAGIKASRLDLHGGVPMSDYLRLHSEIDLMLDSFPFTGHTVSLHGLWMGVPLITLTGKTHVSRRGVGILSNLNMTELIAKDQDDYVRIATAWAADVPRLVEIRRGLRRRMQQSPLCDAVGVTRKLEAAYRSMWRDACSHGPNP